MADDDEPKVPKWVTEPPELTIVPDSALSSDDPDADTFDLARQVGPLFDILRHPKTETPFAAAIYGDWGTGGLGHGRVPDYPPRAHDVTDYRLLDTRAGTDGLQP